MKKKTILLLAAAVLVYIFFYAIIPVSLIHEFKFGWAFLGGFATGACIFLAGRMSDEEKYNIDMYAQNKKRETAFIVPAVLVAIIGSGIIAFHYYTRQTEFLKANPVITDGVVID